MAPATERHRERAREWFKRHVAEVLNPIGGVVGYRVEWSGEVESDLAALLAEVEAPLQARCAALEAVMRRFAVASSRAGLLLARSNQALDAPASSISAELAIRETQEDVEAALSGSDSAFKAMLVRAVMLTARGLVSMDAVSELAWKPRADAIAERAMRGE